MNKSSEIFVNDVSFFCTNYKQDYLVENERNQFKDKLDLLRKTTQVLCEGIINICYRTVNEEDSPVLDVTVRKLQNTVNDKIEQMMCLVFPKLNEFSAAEIQNPIKLDCSSKIQSLDVTQSKDPFKWKITHIYINFVKDEVVLKKGNAEETYCIKGKIGEGGLAVVYKIVSKSAKEGVYKNKVLKCQKDLHAYCFFSNKINMLNQFVDPKTGVPVKRVPGLMRLKYLDESGYSISELCSGDLTSSIASFSCLSFFKKKRSFEFVSRMITQTAFAVNHLHINNEKKPGLVHFDIKPANILFEQIEDEAKSNFYVSDFDGIMEIKNPTDNEPIITPLYSPIRDLNEWERNRFNGAYMTAFDVYALGISWAELLSRIQLSLSIDRNSALQSAISAKDIRKQVGLSGHLNLEQADQLLKICALIEKMTANHWENRITMSKCVEELTSAGLTMPTLS